MEPLDPASKCAGRLLLNRLTGVVARGAEQQSEPAAKPTALGLGACPRNHFWSCMLWPSEAEPQQLVLEAG